MGKFGLAMVFGLCSGSCGSDPASDEADPSQADALAYALSEEGESAEAYWADMNRSASAVEQATELDPANFRNQECIPNGGDDLGFCDYEYRCEPGIEWGKWMTAVREVEPGVFERTEGDVPPCPVPAM